MFRFVGVYAIRAPLFPALLSLLPLVGALVALFPGFADVWSVLLSIVVASGGVYALGELGRDLGKRKEPQLFEQWGGKPTTQALRYHGPRSKQAVERLHQQLERLFPELRLPSPEAEAADPTSAEELYEEAAARLRSLTRDRKRFPLVFAENCSYGFRRNALGLRPIGAAVSVISLLATGGLLILASLRVADVSVEAILAAVLLSALLSAFWIFVVRPDWVEVPAAAYAERLLEAVPILQSAGARLTEREQGRRGA